MKNFGGLLEQSVRALEVECLPKDLPDIIIVDVSALNIGDSIHISQVKLPQGVVPANTDEDFTVATIVAPSAMKAEEEETATAEGEVPIVGEEEAEAEGGEAEGGEEA